MSFSHKILVGLVAGVACGLFFGELVAPLSVVADGFIKLLQMTVLPYVTVSIVASLGRLDAAQAKRLGLQAGLTLLTLSAIAIGVAFLFPLVFPSTETASFFTASLIEKPPPFDFIGLYIPSNPFNSLANNVVPAVVLFSLIVGVALIGVEKKGLLLDVLGLVSTTIARATRFVVQLTPYGVFALAATAAGTMSFDQLARIQVYLVAYMALSLLLALWILPGLVAAVTPIPYADVLGPTRDALITAFIAGDLFIVLPILVDACKSLLEKHGVVDQDTAGLPDVIVPASFNFPHSGKLLSLSFILFAGWFAGTAVPVTQYPRLALTGALSFFGSLNAAMPFLLNVFRIPAETFQLFIATGVINSRFGTLAAAVHTVAMALIGTTALSGKLRLEPQRIVRYVVITLLLTAGVVVGLRVTFRTVLARDYKGAERVYGMTSLFENGAAGIVPTTSAPDDLTRSVFQQILRVGFVGNRLPFAFRNGKRDLVGFDVELAQLLAHDLDVRVEFSEFQPEELVSAAAAGRCDIGIGGTPVTPRLATIARFSTSYLDETLAFVVKDYLRNRFETWDSIAQIRDLTIGVPPLPYYERTLATRLPGVPFKRLDPSVDPLTAAAGFDAVVLPAERGSVFTLLHPEWGVVVPQPGIVKVPLAFPLAGRDEEWPTIVDTWIGLKQRDGTIDALYDHWILGKTSESRLPRWSIIRDVLHWVK